MIELICNNDSYNIEWLEIFAKYGIEYPKKGEKLELLRVVKYPRLGRKGLIVSNYNNQIIPGSFMGESTSSEVSFNYTRFNLLDGTQLTEELVKELQKQLKEQDKLIKT